MMRKLFLLSLALIVLLLSACDEASYEPTPSSTPTPAADGTPPAGMTAEPMPMSTPEPNMELPDEWPTAYLPEGFPVLEYTDIGNVRRENGEIKMTVTTAHGSVMDGEYKRSASSAFLIALIDKGYYAYPLPPVYEEETLRQCYFNQEGTVCDMITPRDVDDPEYTVWEMTVKQHQVFDFDTSAYFKDWPPLDTDLGLEKIAFDKWPAEYLPVGFPEPIGITPATMVQVKHGVFITFTGDTGDYTQQIKDAGYAQKGNQGPAHPDYYKAPWFNSNNDRVYIFDGTVTGTESGLTLQVIKGEDTERYWQTHKPAGTPAPAPDAFPSASAATPVSGAPTPVSGSLNIPDLYWYEYRTDVGGLSITKYKGNDAEVTIPAEIDERKVLIINAQSFMNCTNLTNVVIPDGVIYIEDGVFWGCTALTDITIPESVTRMGIFVFYKCKSLTSVTIPTGVKNIPTNMFLGCSGLTKVIMSGVTSIGENAFSGCENLTSITMPNVTSIAADAFQACGALDDTTKQRILEINPDVEFANNYAAPW